MIKNFKTKHKTFGITGISVFAVKFLLWMLQFLGVIDLYGNPSLFEAMYRTTLVLTIIAEILFIITAILSGKAKDEEWLAISIIFIVAIPILWLFGMLPLSLATIGI